MIYSAILMLLLNNICVSPTTTFCDLLCEDNRLTAGSIACKYPDILRKPQCVSHEKWAHITPANQAELLSLHNMYRDFIAQGLHGLFPKASNMKELQWSTDLEEIALRWLNQCQDTDEDPCLSLGRIERGLSIGMYIEEKNFLFSVDDHPSKYVETTHIMSWFTEGYRYFKAKQLENYTFDAKTARFSQMIWADSDSVGCGGIGYAIGGMDRQSLVCVYSPAGNKEGSNVYREGPVRSECPEGYHHTSKYLGLCKVGGHYTSGAYQKLPSLGVLTVFTYAVGQFR